MGHEALIHGRIVGATWRSGERFTRLHDLNMRALESIPDEDEWPWLVRGIFALPAAFPEGTYRCQVIHFGLSIKDDPGDRNIWDVWLSKFETLLRALYWYSATAQLDTDFEPTRLLEWSPTAESLKRLHDDPPHPVSEWSRSVRVIA